MAKIRFPNPRYATIEGFVALGGRLTTENLLEAYRQGIFPWPMDGLPLPWVCPDERAILEFKALHIPRSLAKARRRTTLHFTLDQAFPQVIRHCAQVYRPDQPGTWITTEMIRAYQELHRAGHAHSVEVWEGDELVGGLYGVDAGGTFGGESMFHLRPNASKLALLYLIDHLSSRGLDWLDVQVASPHMEALGAKVISRDEFLDRLASTQARGLKLFD